MILMEKRGGGAFIECEVVERIRIVFLAPVIDRMYP